MKNKATIKNDVQTKQSREDYFAELRQSLKDSKNGRLISLCIPHKFIDNIKYVIIANGSLKI